MSIFKKNIFSVILILSTIAISAQTPCSGGMAGGFPCDGYDLQAQIEIVDMGGKAYAGSNPMEATDSWGWTDPSDGKEYAIICMNDGTAFVDISTPTAPRFLGRLESETSTSWWRDVKVYNNYAFIVSDDNGNHGMQVFDLTKLRGLSTSSGANASMRTFSEDNHLTWGNGGNKGKAHNVFINEDTGYLYILGASRGGGSPLMVDIQNPLATLSYTILDNVVQGSTNYGYCHDAQVVTYNGPDPDYQGREILVGAFGSSLKIELFDVTNKTEPVHISNATYQNQEYTHQGWFTEDQRFFIVGDEVDEENMGGGTRTFIFDFEDLDNPILHHTYTSTTSIAIDHNGYVVGNRFYLANYNAGMRVMKVDGLYDEDVNGNPTPTFTEDSYFDTHPSTNAATFYGAWNVYPFFESGNIIISDLDEGLIIVKDPNFDDEDPIAVCQAYTATLDAVTGTVTINASDLDGGSTDNFGIISSTLEGQTTFTCDDVGNTFNVTLTVEDDYGNTSSCIAEVTVQAATSTFAAGTWDVNPNLGSNALFNDNYDTDTFGNVIACSCEIESGKTVNVNAGGYLDITGNILVNGNLNVEHEGSVVQQDKNGLVTNNGSITVEKITPTLTDMDFTILGSPMSAETTGGVYASASFVRNHITGNFTPNPDVESQDPGAENFADDNGDNWLTHTGTLDVGAGYLVKPFVIGGATGTYTTNYTQGTLNNGDITFTAVYGDNQNDSPNILSNPYASAIRIDDFLNDNTIAGGTVYFWEHLTAPSNYPGYNANNYDMGDLSSRNATGGLAATNGGGIPTNLMPSGQGFGIKASAAGTITFNNCMRSTGPNTGYRNNGALIDRLYISVVNNTYGLKSNTLIGFTDLATNGFDQNYDSKRLPTPISIYSLNSNRELGIQGRSLFNENHEIPLGFSTQVQENQEYTILIGSLEGNLIGGAMVYLKDNILNTVTNLSETDYTFTSNAGHQTNRFVLVFSEEFFGTSGTSLESITLYPNPTQNILNIVSPQADITSIEVYDLRGRKMNTIDFNNQSNYQVDLSNLVSALYFIKINTVSGSITKRIIKN